MTVKNINYNVYGEKSTWFQNKYNNYITYNPTWGKGGSNVALSYGYLFENKIQINEKIDDSICPFGIAGDCDIFAHNAVIWNEGEEVKKITGAGTGSCKGCRCIPKIQMLIDENN